jgi:tetratricopeptide (TPR) repeat protein
MRSVLVCLVLLAACAPKAAAPDAASTEARGEASRHFRAGMADVAACQFDQGIAELKAANAIVPAEDTTFNIDLATKEKSQGMPACAHRLFRDAMVEIAAKRYDAGIAKLKEANDVAPEPDVVFNIAKAYEDAGDRANAVAYYRKYLESNAKDRAVVESTIARLQSP